MHEWSYKSSNDSFIHSSFSLPKIPDTDSDSDVYAMEDVSNGSGNSASATFTSKLQRRSSPDAELKSKQVHNSNERNRYIQVSSICWSRLLCILTQLFSVLYFGMCVCVCVCVCVCMCVCELYGVKPVCMCVCVCD